MCYLLCFKLGLQTEWETICPECWVSRREKCAQTLQLQRNETSSVGTGCPGRTEERCIIPSGRDRKGFPKWLNWVLRDDEECSGAWSRSARNAYVKASSLSTIWKVEAQCSWRGAWTLKTDWLPGRHLGQSLNLSVPQSHCLIEGHQENIFLKGLLWE